MPDWYYKDYGEDENEDENENEDYKDDEYDDRPLVNLVKVNKNGTVIIVDPSGLGRWGMIHQLGLA